jgi:endonuclease VIII
VIHSHLRMTGRLAGAAARLVIHRGDVEVVQFKSPVLELMTASRARLDQRLADLGPDIVAAAPFDEARFLRRLRDDDPTRTIGDALLDQNVVAGIGNVWKSEGCWLAGLDPWWAVGATSNAEALALVRAVRPLMQESAFHGHQERCRSIHGRAALPCPRCGLIRKRGQADGNHTTYRCPSCHARAMAQRS